MTEFAGLEQRMARALERLQRGLESVPAAPSGEGLDAADLKVRLDDEKLVNAQLQERIKMLTSQQSTASKPLEDKIAAQDAQISSLADELEQLRAANAELSDAAAQLRDGASDSASDAAMINSALVAEVEALKAERSAYTAEIASILAELKPLLEEA